MLSRMRNGIALTCYRRGEFPGNCRSKRRKLNQINSGVNPPPRADRNFIGASKLPQIRYQKSGALVLNHSNSRLPVAELRAIVSNGPVQERLQGNDASAIAIDAMLPVRDLGG